MQTEAIMIGDLVHHQIKDDTGKVLPKEATEGETSWLVTDLNKASGRLLQSDRTSAMARNFSCGYSGLLCGSQVSFYKTFLPDGTVALFADILGQTCTSGTPNACTGQHTGTAYFSTTWTSLSPSIAAVSGASTNHNVNRLGVSGGSSQVNGRITSSYCQSGGGGPATVQLPKSLSAPTFQSVTPVTNGPVVDYFGNTPRTGYCGVYQNNASDLMDSTSGTGHKIITSSNFTLTESFSNYTSTFGGTTPPTQSSPQNTSV
jgi:hypothetical protein